MSKKATKIEKEKNVLQVVDWIIGGCSDRDILKKIKEEFNVGIRAARNYKKWGFERIQVLNNESVETKRKLRILQTEKKLKQLLDSNKLDAKLINSFVNLQTLLMKLEGTENPKKVQISGDQDNPLHVIWKEEKTYINPEEDLIADE